MTYSRRETALPLLSAPHAVPSLIVVGTVEDEDNFALRLGSLIAKLRLDRDMGQEKLAELLQVDKSTLSRWERGLNPPKAYQLQRIAMALGCPAEWLLNPPDAMSDLDRAIQAAVEQGRLAAYRPRRRATRRDGAGHDAPPAPRRLPSRRGSSRP